jgi:hypothetical protein
VRGWQREDRSASSWGLPHFSATAIFAAFSRQKAPGRGNEAASRRIEEGYPHTPAGMTRMVLRQPHWLRRVTIF